MPLCRFGDKERVIQTVFGTLHDLDLIWQTQEELEAQKKEPKQVCVCIEHSRSERTLSVLSAHCTAVLRMPQLLPYTLILCQCARAARPAEFPVLHRL